ncbi:hypothetical protein J7E99_21945 [Streptomyces sp. ISL-44]|uniref:hypothetical protein n=1 Tax=Streptomyces sp. ISL-44 TaxID=2819184 RepID=UPI001BEA8701|nr:hypothetical protein [Streptomyces sp. ISL-44]MBT2543286.1 hypothetical protein [Streptomyces sp. ISL-44]
MQPGCQCRLKLDDLPGAKGLAGGTGVQAHVPGCDRPAHTAARTGSQRSSLWPVCQSEFTTDVSPRRLFCSAECRNTARTSKDALEARTCPSCDGAFEAARTIRQVYCSPTCRRDADRHRGQARDEERARRLGETPPPPLPPLPELPPPPKPAHRPGASRQMTAERDPLEPAATRNCPHCQQPVTIVALLATPEAARPAMPVRSPDIIPLRRTP